MDSLALIGTNNNVGICSVCGSTFEIKSKGKPRLYCSDDCRDLNKYLNQVEDKIIHINNGQSFKDFTPNDLKGRLLRISNLLICKPRLVSEPCKCT